MDIVIGIVPLITLGYGFTAAGPALLKGVLDKNGFSSKIIDFNNEYDKCFNEEQKLKNNHYFEEFSFYNTDVYNSLENITRKWANELIDVDSRWIGISVFSFDSYRYTKLLAIMIKSINPSKKIVIGGNGLGDDSGINFAKELYDLNIIDAYIIGEAEVSLVELLKDNMDYPSINNSNRVVNMNLDDLPFPNFDDYDLTEHKNRYGVVSLPITGSRGCVRNCSFCDVRSIWKKFTYRSGKSIANEIINGVTKYNVTSFSFTDSLINGSRTAFADMIFHLAEYRKTLNEDKKFTFDSHFIIRGKKHMPPVVFDKMKEAGVGTLYIGVESGSEVVRNHMKKGFSQEDLDYCMEQLARCNIQMRLLLIVGYLTETEQDFQDTLDMFDRYKKYNDIGVIKEVRMGLTLLIINGSPLYKKQSENDILMDSNHSGGWICKSNPTLTFAERLRRRIKIQEHIVKLGYSMTTSSLMDKELYNKWVEYKGLNLEEKFISDNFIYDKDKQVFVVLDNENNNKVKIT